MSIVRSTLLAASQSPWLRDHVTQYRFVRRAVSRFMPGETSEGAFSAAWALRQKRIGTVLTYLGENIKDPVEAAQVTSHYLGVLDRSRAQDLRLEISVKLTQLGLDLSPDLCYRNLETIINHVDTNSVVWIDMEASNYVDRTLELYRRVREVHSNVGVCLQAYLYRTAADLAALLPLGAAIRLVKGAYKEPPDLAFPRKRDVDENYFALAAELLGDKARQANVRAAFATHDRELIRRINEHAQSRGVGKDCFEFQMLYGIQQEEQCRLAREGWKSSALIAYGSYWFPWFMRRLAERPANLWFVARNLFPG